MIAALANRERLGRRKKIQVPMFGIRAFVAVVALASVASLGVAGVMDVRSKIRETVDGTIRPLMARYGIPGMAVGVLVDGEPHVFNYGMASADTRRAVTSETLFELGSISKTFTATLASYAQVRRRLSWSDETSRHLPLLRGSRFGELTLLELATHTTGLPLQWPDDVRTDDQLVQYLKGWRPDHEPGTYRTYGNPGIGALGWIAAKSWGQDFSTLLAQRLFPALGMNSSFVDVPDARMADYAQGRSKEGVPIRMAPGVLSSEAYGVKSTAADMLRFLAANMGLVELDEKLQRAIDATHTGYFKAGAMTQDLVWEQYSYPVALNDLLEGNSTAMILGPMKVDRIVPAQQPLADVWINKTGSTHGFGAYVAFVPAKRLGIVILANRNFPVDERVNSAFTIMRALAGPGR